MEILKKIVIKAVVSETLKSYAAALKDKETVDLVNVYGRASGKKVGETNFGGYTALLGTFEAVELATGSVYASSVAILPEPANGMTLAALSASDAGSVDFAFTIGVKRRDDLAIGYEFTCKPLMKASEADPLAALREQARAALPAPIPAPDAAEKPKGGKAK